MGTIGMSPWRAGCPGTGTSGSASGLGRRTDSNADTAPQADSTYRLTGQHHRDSPWRREVLCSPGSETDTELGEGGLG
jgi:hypothetical protein